MTFEESIAALGLNAREGTLTQAEVRKAYVALIKVHKPERDPEAFQRVREAYDCLLEALKVGEQSFAPAQQADRDFPRGKPADHSPTPSPGDAEQASSNALRNALNEAADDATYVQILSGAVHDRPHATDLRWELIAHYESVHEYEIAQRLIREGAALGLAEFVTRLAMQEPEAIDEAQLEKLDGIPRIAVLIARGAKVEAKAAWKALLQESENSAQPLSRSAVCHLALIAIEHDSAPFAERLFTSMRKHHPLFVSDVNTPLLESMTRDLLPLRSRIPAAYFKAFALSIRRGPEQATPTLRALREYDVREARDVSAALDAHFPILARWHGATLIDPIPNADVRATMPMNWRGFAFVVLLVVAAIRTLGGTLGAGGRDELPRTLIESDVRGDAPQPEDAPALETAVSLEDAVEVRNAVARLCLLESDVCRDARRLAGNIAAHRCVIYDATHINIRDRRGPAADALQVLRDAALAACGDAEAQP